VYNLTQERLEQVERLGKKSAANLIEQIEQSKSRDFWRLIYGLGIRHVGERGAQALAGAFGSIDALQTASREQLQAVPDIGPVVAAAVHDYFAQEPNRQLVNALKAAGLKMDAPLVSASVPGPLSGKTFVLTGTLETMSREQATEAIQAQGGRVSGSVSKKTDHLVAGSEAGSKLTKAEALGISVLDEAAFRKLLGL
jgi:DNA ligase (NAD+)